MKTISDYVNNSMSTQSMPAGGITGLVANESGDAPMQSGWWDKLTGASVNRQGDVAMAREQMRYNEEMSNTSYQRAVNDLQKAGLNPALAYQQGGASTPQASSPINRGSNAGQGISAVLGAVLKLAGMSIANSQQVAKLAMKEKIATMPVSSTTISRYTGGRIITDTLRERG